MLRVTGWGSALPSTVVTNADFEARLETTDEWIVERTGIRERRVGGTTEGLAVEAGKAALAQAGTSPADVEAVVLATSTPDQALPATAVSVASALGVPGGAFDVNAACSGFVYGLVVAQGLLATGMRRILLVGAETMSRITDQDDRGTAILFADGAGAVVVESAADRGDLLGWDLGADGALRQILYADHGGHLTMHGREVFRQAVRVTVASAEAALERAGVDAGDIALFVPHQANVRIMDAVSARLGLPLERTVNVLDRTGNTSAASIPIGIAAAADSGRLSPGDLVLLCGFGAGMTWATAVLRWHG